MISRCVGLRLAVGVVPVLTEIGNSQQTPVAPRALLTVPRNYTNKWWYLLRFWANWTVSAFPFGTSRGD